MIFVEVWASPSISQTGGVWLPVKKNQKLCCAHQAWLQIGLWLWQPFFPLEATGRTRGRLRNLCHCGRAGGGHSFKKSFVLCSHTHLNIQQNILPSIFWLVWTVEVRKRSIQFTFGKLSKKPRTETSKVKHEQDTTSKTHDNSLKMENRQARFGSNVNTW